MTQTLSAITNHRNACDAFSAIVARGDGHWTNQFPCPEWDARGVVEHVIGFHDALLLEPTGTKPTRPSDDPIARWAMTVSAIDSATQVASANELLPALTAEVLAHTWDLAEALGVDPDLDRELAEISLTFMRANEEQVRASGLFGAAVTVPDSASAATQLLAFLGRDPGRTR